jgi:hypothetical protein
MKDEYDDEEGWGSVEDLVDGLGADPFNPFARAGAAAGSRPVRWRDITPEDTPASWIVLRDWVEWVTVRFDVPVSLIPNCWWRHPPLVEELSALHTAWATAYDPQDSGLGPVMWLERWNAARGRLRTAYPGSCSSSHNETKPRSWDNATDQGEWNAWVNDAHGQ